MSFAIGTMIGIHGMFCNGEAPSTVFLGSFQPQRQTAEETMVGIGQMKGDLDLVSSRAPYSS